MAKLNLNDQRENLINEVFAAMQADQGINILDGLTRAFDAGLKLDVSSIKNNFNGDTDLNADDCDSRYEQIPELVSLLNSFHRNGIRLDSLVYEAYVVGCKRLADELTPGWTMKHLDVLDLIGIVDFLARIEKSMGEVGRQVSDNTVLSGYLYSYKGAFRQKVLFSKELRDRLTAITKIDPQQFGKL